MVKKSPWNVQYDFTISPINSSGMALITKTSPLVICQRPQICDRMVGGWGWATWKKWFRQLGWLDTLYYHIIPILWKHKIDVPKHQPGFHDISGLGDWELWAFGIFAGILWIDPDTNIDRVGPPMNLLARVAMLLYWRVSRWAVATKSLYHSIESWLVENGIPHWITK